MLNIGIFLGWAPHQSMRSQGIGRLMALIIQALTLNKEQKIIIACPKWYTQHVHDLLNDFNIPHDNIELLMTKSIPIAVRFIHKKLQPTHQKNISPWNIYRHFKNYLHKYLVHFIEFDDCAFGNKYNRWYIFKSIFKKNARKALISYKRTRDLFYGKNYKQFHIFKHYGKQYFRKLLVNCIASDSPTKFFVNGVQLVLAFLMISILAPLCLFAKLAIKLKTLTLSNHSAQKVIATLRKYQNFSVADLKNHPLAVASYNQIRENELTKLTSLINSRPEIKLWYIPSMFWPEIANIKATKIVCAPDVVFFDFPTHFKDELSQNTLQLIQKSIQAADGLICYSNHVKQTHFIKKLNVNPNIIKVVNHGWVDLTKYIENDASKIKIKNYSGDLLQKYFDKMPKPTHYLSNFNISRLSFFFYSSQSRLHKNLLNLIKAYQYALRRKYIACKLIITAKITDPEILNYIATHRLQYEIIEMHDVPNNILAALNNLAVCSVNPSYFEGGFPFTFSEAYSVGTPSIMSNIPAVREIIDDPELIDLMLFDPTDYKDMAEKMVWAFNNRELLLEKQKSLAETLKARSWEKVAVEYIETMQKIATVNESRAQELHKTANAPEYS